MRAAPFSFPGVLNVHWIYHGDLPSKGLGVCLKGRPLFFFRNLRPEVGYSAGEFVVADFQLTIMGYVLRFFSLDLLTAGLDVVLPSFARCFLLC